MPLAMLRRRPAAFRTGLPVLAAAVLATVLATMASAPATAQPDTRLCNAEVESKLRELPLAEGDIKSVRVVEETNLDEFGPPILGVEGWVRLNSCSGWLVINMRPTCYILQTYTRGDCRIEGVPSY
ncbi:MAG TPA: hypothetical protein VIS03_12665 [Kiloniellaceae bacterium]